MVGSFDGVSINLAISWLTSARGFTQRAMINNRIYWCPRFVKFRHVWLFRNERVVTKESWRTARMRPSKFFFLFLLHCWYLCFKNINCFRFGKRGLVLRVRFYIFAFGRKREINPSGYSFLYSALEFGLFWLTPMLRIYCCHSYSLVDSDSPFKRNPAVDNWM